MWEKWNREKSGDISKATQLVGGRTRIRSGSSDSFSNGLLPPYNLSFKKGILKTLILKFKEAVNWFYQTDLLNTDQQSGCSCRIKRINFVFRIKEKFFRIYRAFISPGPFLERMTEGCTDRRMEQSICVFTAFNYYRKRLKSKWLIHWFLRCSLLRAFWPLLRR